MVHIDPDLDAAQLCVVIVPLNWENNDEHKMEAQITVIIGQLLIVCNVMDMPLSDMWIERMTKFKITWLS